ncbi:DUF2868 domain-containing protein, partial [Myxococcota bacterium]|nr:DUF2868 domain-containing protein [Myxococcota bacterium]
MKLWTLIDLEAQLLKDRAEDRAALKARDRKIGQALSADLRTMDPEDPQDRQALFTCWLDAARAEADGPTLGERLESGQRLLSAALITLGGVLGISAASVVLHFNGVAPINAIHFLALFVFLPLGLLSLYPLTTWLWRKDLFEEDLLGLHQALRWLRDWMGRRIFKWAADSSEARAHIALQRRLKALGALYADVERWHLVDLANRFGVAFYACAFLTGLYLITFSDLAFGWSTTLDISAEGFRGLLKWLAWPWGFLGLPSEEMIEQTRHYRAQHTGATPLSKEALKMMGGWWPFLLTSLFVYGLLPRIGLLIWARRRGAKLLAAMRLNHGDFQALYERLAFEELIVCAPEPEGPAPTQRPVPVVIAARSSRKFQIREAEPEEIAASAPEPAPRQEIPEAAPLERVVPQVIRAPHARPEKRQGQHIEIIEPAPVLDPAPEPLIEPVIEPVAAPEPVPEPVIEPVAAPEPVPEPVIEPVAAPEPVPEPVIELVIEPVAAPEPVPEPVIEPVAAPEPVPEPVIEPVAAPEPVPEPVIEPVAAPEPVPEPVIEPVAAPEPVPEPVIEPVIEPVAAPEPVPEPIIAPEPIPEPVPEPIIAPKPEEPAPDLVIKTEPITAPLSESRPSLIGSKFKPIKSALGSLKPAAFPFKFSNNSPNLTPPSSSPAKKTPLKPASEPPKALPEPPKPAPEPPKALPEPPKALPEPPKPAPEPPKPAPEPPKPAPEPPKPAPKVLSEPPKPAPEPPKALPE